MKKIFYILIAVCLVISSCTVTPVQAVDYYISPTGTSTGTGAIGSPWDLDTGLNRTTECAPGNTFYLRGGTYSGKFFSTLGNCTVRSYTGEWAVLDGYRTTTLTTGINTTQQNLTVASTGGLFGGMSVAIDTEIMQISTVNSATALTVNRNWGGTIGGAANHLAAATVIHTGNQLQVSGSNTTYRDFEVKNSYTQRDLEPGAITGEGCCGFYAIVRGAGISQQAGSGNNYINLRVHDNLDGFFIGGSTSNTTIYGNLIFNNGGHYFDTGEGREAGSGHGIYAENSAGYSRIYSNISVNNFNFNGQFYGVSAAYVGGDHQNNAFANAGSPLSGLISPAIRNFNIIYGPNTVQSPTANIVNNHYFAPQASLGGTPANIGYAAGIAQATITGNYFVGGPATVGIGNIGTVVSFSNNKIYGETAVGTFVNKSPGVAVTAWNNNTYYKSSGRTVFLVDTVGSFNFTGWKTQTGLDSTSTETSAAMPDTAVVIPNTYETGRANIIIYAPSLATSINVNLSTTGLVNGQNYVIKNAFNWDGGNVATGAYNSASPTISVPLNTAAASVAAPIGLGFTPATTAPDLAILVVIPTTSVITCRYFFAAAPNGCP